MNLTWHLTDDGQRYITATELVLLGRIEAAFRVNASNTARKVWHDIRDGLDTEDMGTDRGRWAHLVDEIADRIR